MLLRELFGKKLKQIRNAKNLTQQEFAELCDMEPNSIALVESGKRGATFPTIELFARVLGVDYTDLFDFKNEFELEKSEDRMRLELGRRVYGFNKTMLSSMIDFTDIVEKLSKNGKKK